VPPNYGHGQDEVSRPAPAAARNSQSRPPSTALFMCPSQPLLTGSRATARAESVAAARAIEGSRSDFQLTEQKFLDGILAYYADTGLNTQFVTAIG
jgi:hypothetical protein